MCCYNEVLCLSSSSRCVSALPILDKGAKTFGKRCFETCVPNVPTAQPLIQTHKYSHMHTHTHTHTQLFHLVASSYQNHCKSIDILKQRGMDIYWTFFLEQSPLPLEVEQGTRQRICKSNILLLIFNCCIHV